MRVTITKVGSLFLIAMLCAYSVGPFSSSVFAQDQQPQQAVSVLTNQDVLDMLKMGLTQEIILAKIKSSSSKFDTTPKALQDLKAANVTDAIILAMVQTGTPAPTAASIVPTAIVPAGPVKVLVPDGTAVEIELIQTASSEELKEGDPVAFKVIRPVEINGVTIIKKDAAARGHVSKVKKAGRWGKQGKLDWAMNDAISVDGTKIPLRFTQAARGDSKGGTVAVAAIATTVLLGPLGLLWGLKKGKPAIIPAGNKYTVYVDRENTVSVIGESSKP
jgi:hypothetical protein